MTAPADDGEREEIERTGRRLADEVRRRAPYGPADLADLAALVDQLGPARTP